MGRRTGNFEHYDSGRTGERIRDPYIPLKGFSEPTICPVCSAVYHKKRWIFDNDLLKKFKNDANVQLVKCPADRKIEDKYAMGKVLLTGAFVNDHTDEILNVIKGEENRAKENNPLDRLIKVEKMDGGIYAETTSDALAMRIGHHLKEAYKCSDAEFDFRLGDKFVEVKWHREA